MKAVWYDKQGPAREVLKYDDMQTPQAGAGEVRIKLEASGGNPSEPIVGRAVRTQWNIHA